jgi:hypothetical protein
VTVYVIGRSGDGGKTLYAYLGQNGTTWEERGSVAKWFNTAEEAAKHVEDHMWVCEHTYIKPFDPVGILPRRNP